MEHKYEIILEEAIFMLNNHEDLEPKSALKQCASDYGIKYGEEMGKFITWTMGEL